MNTRGVHFVSLNIKERHSKICDLIKSSNKAHSKRDLLPLWKDTKLGDAIFNITKDAKMVNELLTNNDTPPRTRDMLSKLNFSMNEFEALVMLKREDNA